MKKRFTSMLLAMVMSFSLIVPAFAEFRGTDMNKMGNGEVVKRSNSTVEISSENLYYDAELGAYAVAFTLNSDGTVNVLSKREATAITNRCEKINEQDLTAGDPVQHPLRDYRQWYEFKQIGRPVRVTGSTQKVSPDIAYSAGGTHISKTVSCTSTHYFSASVNTSEKQSAVQAGATIGWQRSATASTTITFDLKPGQCGYIGFCPYYNRVYGNLELHGNWGDGIIGTYEAYGYSVCVTNSGEADGLFKFVLTKK